MACNYGWVFDAVKTISILGATGSIGTQTAALIDQFPNHFKVDALVAHSNVDALAKMARKLSANFVVIGDDSCYDALKTALADTNIICAAGQDAAREAAARKVDLVVAAITGIAGLVPCYAALEQGNDLALANKEALVCAGTLLTELAKRNQCQLLPLDSEHNALFQLMAGWNNEKIDKLVLTASGGPFRQWSYEAMKKITIEDALKHPNWSMGAKISIDSATMMNKGLELIEAHYLFNTPPNAIEIIVHPESIIHGMITLQDGSQFAAFGKPDMRAPIAHCLGWPERLHQAIEPIDLTTIGRLNFESPDLVKFSAISLARAAVTHSQAACVILNAANEYAVDAFLNAKISFNQIVSICQQVLESRLDAGIKIVNLSDILALDQATRQYADQLVKNW